MQSLFYALVIIGATIVYGGNSREGHHGKFTMQSRLVLILTVVLGYTLL